MISPFFINKLNIDWNVIDKKSYLRKIPALNGMEEVTFNQPITFFVGENGSGKSTLLEAIAIAYGFNPEGGTRNYSFSTYDSHSELCNALRLTRGYRKSQWGYFLRAESFYNVSTMDMEYGKEMGGTPHFYHEKSHGESFLAVIQDNFGKNGMYLLDEPEAALSPQRQLSLLIEMQKCIKEGSQFIVVSHSPILLGMPNAEILSFSDEKPIHPIKYEETDSYIITKSFVNNREKMINNLLDGII